MRLERNDFPTVMEVRNDLIISRKCDRVPRLLQKLYFPLEVQIKRTNVTSLLYLWNKQPRAWVRGCRPSRIRER